MRHVRFLLSAAVCALAVSTACAAEVKLTVTEPAGVARQSANVTSGVPFARGEVADVSKLSATVAGKPAPAQFQKLSAWPDGSVRWALLDTQVSVPAGGKVDLVVRDGGSNPAPASPVKVSEAGDSVTISTGPMQVVVSRNPFNIKSVKVDGKELVTSAGRGLVLYTTDGKEVAAGNVEKATVEQAGPVRATVCLEGKYPGLHNGLLTWTVRLTASAGGKALKVHAWLGNRGAHGYTGYEEKYSPEWYLFDGMAVELGLGLGDGVKATCDGAASETGRLVVRQICKPYEYGWDNFEYTIRNGDAPAPVDPKKKSAKEEEAADATLLKTGARTDGVVAMTGPSGALTLAVRDFWQNHDKVIDLDKSSLKVWLWPRDGFWPRRSKRPTHYGYVSSQIDPITKPDAYALCGAIRKGHEMILDFSGASAEATHADVARPLMAVASADYYAATEAAPGMFAPPAVKSGDGEVDFKMGSWNRMAQSIIDPGSKSSIEYARTGGSNPMCYWYGWMDYGDLAVPQGLGPGPVSLHYDYPWIVLVNYLRFGDPGFMDLATAMVRHRVDIDQLWSGDREKEPYRDLSRDDYAYRDYHCARFTRAGPNVGSDWISGMVLYYMLTGDAMTHEAIMTNARGIENAWERARKEDSGATWRGSITANDLSVQNFCALYDLTGEKKYLDQALLLFKENIVPLWKRVGPFLHDPNNQIRGQDYAGEDIAYCYSIRTWCELHRRSGDELVTKYLNESCEKEFSESFYDAPLFLSDLYAYMGMVNGDKKLVEQGAENFILGFPESKCPPVWMRDDSKWSKTAATTLRTAHVLQFVLWNQARK